MTYADNNYLILEQALGGPVIMRYYRTIFWLFVTIIFVQALAPINGVNSKLNNTYIFIIRLDYLVHVAMFACLSVLLRLAYFPQQSVFFSKAIWYFSLMLFIAFFSEAIQWFVPYRVFNINDLVANFLGVILSLPLIRNRLFFSKNRGKYLRSDFKQVH
jgi:VanZ family protein